MGETHAGIRWRFGSTFMSFYISSVHISPYLQVNCNVDVSLSTLKCIYRRSIYVFGALDHRLDFRDPETLSLSSALPGIPFCLRSTMTVRRLNIIPSAPRAELAKPKVECSLAPMNSCLELELSSRSQIGIESKSESLILKEFERICYCMFTSKQTKLRSGKNGDVQKGRG